MRRINHKTEKRNKLLYRLSLNDSLLTNVPWRFYEHPKREQPGLLFDLPTYDLPRGEYWLKIEDQGVKNDSLIWRQWALIQFMR